MTEALLRGLSGAAPHIPRADCWCAPLTTYEDPSTGDRVFTHRVTIH